MWPFSTKKRYPPKGQLIVTDSWVTGHGRHEGKLVVTRFNRGLRDLVGHPAYPHHVGVAVRVTGVGPDGLPGSDESAALYAIEDLLTRVLTADRESLFAGVITGAGMREYVFYASDPRAVKRRLAGIRDQVKTHRLRLMVHPDPDWRAYRAFVR